MALLKIRGADGVVREVVALKGEPGGYAPHTHDLTEITCEGYGSARDYVDLVKEQAELAESIATAAAQSAGEAQEYAEGVNSKLSGVEELADELNAGLVRLEDEVLPSIDEKADEALAQSETAHQYATDAYETAQTAQSDAITAQRMADDVAEQVGNIEAALDGIINIQNALIGGGA